MPQYGWRGRDEKTGVSRGLRTLEGPTAPPTKVDIVEGENDGAKAKCAVCGKSFKAAHVIAPHFRAAHSELNTRKDSWKRYVTML